MSLSHNGLFHNQGFLCFSHVFGDPRLFQSGQNLKLCCINFLAKSFSEERVWRDGSPKRNTPPMRILEAALSSELNTIAALLLFSAARRDGLRGGYEVRADHHVVPAKPCRGAGCTMGALGARRGPCPLHLQEMGKIHFGLEESSSAVLYCRRMREPGFGKLPPPPGFMMTLLRMLIPPCSPAG